MPVPDNEIVNMFQRYLASSDPSEIDNLDFQELIAAEGRLSVRGTSPTFMAVMRVQIAMLVKKEIGRHESKVRAWNLLTGFLLGIAIAGISAWIF